MRTHLDKARSLATSGTARDTYVLFGGNVVSAFLGFIFTLIVARKLTVSDFGVFSAINNLVAIAAAVTDIGISAGLVKFISSFHKKGDDKAAKDYLKASFVIRMLTIFIFIVPLVLFPEYIANNFLATQDSRLTYWTAALSLGLMFWHFFPIIMQAYRRFIASVAVDISVGTTRLILILILMAIGQITIVKVLGSFIIGTIAALITGFSLLGISFLKAKPNKKVYSKLLKFSGWVGVNRVVSAFSGRLDVQMLAVLAGAAATGYYSIASRLALFIVLLTSSFSAVLAPRLSSFENKEKESKYILKATLALAPMVIGAVLWIIFAKPFVVVLFGEKYLPAVGVFRALVASMIPFLLTAPSVTAIIYAMKKPKYIGLFSFFQLASIFLLNTWFIPIFGPYGPTITFMFVHVVLAVYTWLIVIRYYWLSK